MELIKVRAGVATREPLPDFLAGLLPESLADLSWTDPSLGVQDCAWWPSDDQSPALGENQQYGAETLTVDVPSRMVVITRAVVTLPLVLPIQEQYVDAIQAMLDTKVQERRYYGILSACTYSASTNATFKAEAEACVAWRDAVWSKAYEVLDKVSAGTLAQPTIADLLATLPTMEWPAP